MSPRSATNLNLIALGLVLVVGYGSLRASDASEPRNEKSFFGTFAATMGYGYLSSTAQRLLDKARTAAKSGNLRMAEKYYMEAIYSYLWEPNVPDEKQVAAAQEYANVLDKLDKNADSKAVRDRLRYLQTVPHVNGCQMGRVTGSLIKHNSAQLKPK
jgi:hypothetical protein